MAFLLGGASLATSWPAYQTTLRSAEPKNVDFMHFVPQNQKAAILAGTSTWDAHDTLMTAIASIGVNGQLNSKNIAGPVLQLPYGRVHFDQTVELKRSTILQGYGGYIAGSAATQLHFASNLHGIIAQRYDTTGTGLESPTTRGSDRAIIRNLNMKSAGGSTGHGIWMRAAIEVEHVQIESFPQDGFHIVADVTTSDLTHGNANLWSVEHCRSVSNGGHGMFVQGGDSNAGCALRVDCSANGGWGFWDNSFLGNAYLACHTASNALGPYKSDNANARNAFVGCYCESGQPSSDIRSPAVIIGGAWGAGNIGNAFTIGDQDLSAFDIRNLLQARTLRTRFAPSTGVALQLIAEGADHSNGWALYFNESLKCWEWRHALLGNRIPLQFTGDQSTHLDETGAAIPGGNMVLPKPLWIDKPGLRRRSLLRHGWRSDLHGGRYSRRVDRSRSERCRSDRYPPDCGQPRGGLDGVQRRRHTRMPDRQWGGCRRDYHHPGRHGWLVRCQPERRIARHPAE
jgi:hypothetical protein